MLGASSLADDEADTHDEYLRGNPGEWREISQWVLQFDTLLSPDVHAKVGPEWTKSGKGLVASNAIDAGMKMRPTEAELDAMGQE